MAEEIEPVDIEPVVESEPVTEQLKTLSPEASVSKSKSSSSNVVTHTEKNKNPERPPSVWDVYFPRKTDTREEVIYLASFPVIVLFWPTVVALFLGAILQLSGVDSSVVGWMLTCVVFFNFLPLVQDFDQKKFVILLLSVLAFVLMIWIVNLYGFSFLKTLGTWILSFQPQLNVDSCLILGCVLLFLLSWGLLTPLFSYWKFEQNEFVHYTRPMGKDMSITRMGCAVYKDIPDILEYFLTFGGGSIVIRRGDQIVATIENVLFLSRRMEAIEDMLSETRVVVDRL